MSDKHPEIRDLVECESLVIEQITSHWMAQGGEAQFGPLTDDGFEPSNADDVVSALLRVVRARLSEVEAERDRLSAALNEERPAEAHVPDYAYYEVCRICGLTDAAHQNQCHHCDDGMSKDHGRCWWCLRPVPRPSAAEPDRENATLRAECTRLRDALTAKVAEWRTKGASEMDNALRVPDDPKHTAALMAGMRLACADELESLREKPNENGVVQSGGYPTQEPTRG